MVKVTTDVNGKTLGCELYIDGYLKENLDAMNQRIIKKWDNVVAVTGYSGDGKTEWTVQQALYMDHTFNIKRVVFSSEDFEKLIMDKDACPDGSSVLWDESDELADHWASTIMRTLTRVFKRIRKRRLKIFLVTPTFFDFGKYFVMDRIFCLVHIYSDGLERGYFRFFNRKRMRELYIKGKKLWDMEACHPNFRGRFTKIPKLFPIDMSSDGEYEEKKDIATERITQQVGSPKELKYDFYCNLIDFLKEKGVDYTNEVLGSLLGVDKRTVSRYRSQREGLTR